MGILMANGGVELVDSSVSRSSRPLRVSRPRCRGDRLLRGRSVVVRRVGVGTAVPAMGCGPAGMVDRRMRRGVDRRRVRGEDDTADPGQQTAGGGAGGPVQQHLVEPDAEPPQRRPVVPGQGEPAVPVRGGVQFEVGVHRREQLPRRAGRDPPQRDHRGLTPQVRRDAVHGDLFAHSGEPGPEQHRFSGAERGRRGVLQAAVGVQHGQQPVLRHRRRHRQPCDRGHKHGSLHHPPRPRTEPMVPP